MGIQWLGITTTINMLKSIFFVAALVAAVHAEAEADADADAYYSTLGYHGLGYSNYGFNGFRSYAAPAYGYRSYGYAAPYTYGAYRHFGKRSAEAEAEPEADADAAYYSTLGYTGLGYANYGYNGYRSYVAPAYTRSFGYASPYAYNYGAYHHFGKRSADAEPEADADAYYSTLGYHGLGYSNYGFNGYRSYAAAPAYSYGVRSYGYASPYAYGRYFY